MIFEIVDKMSQKVSPGGIFRRLFTCPSAPEVSTISDDHSDEFPVQNPTSGAKNRRGRYLKKRRNEKDDRFRSASNILNSPDLLTLPENNRLSTSECHLLGTTSHQVQKSMICLSVYETIPLSHLRDNSDLQLTRNVLHPSFSLFF